MKSKISIILSIVCLLLASVFAFNFTKSENFVYAEGQVEEELGDENSGESLEPETDISRQLYEKYLKDGYEISVKTELEDTHLYSALLQIFKDYVRETYDYSYTGSSLYSTMFRDFTQITIGEMSIQTLVGLERFKFNELKSLTINNNPIKNISKEVFSNMPKIENLNLGCNEIEKIDISLATTLKNINLSSNKISALDCSGLKSTVLDINLANNNIASMKDIALPTRVDSIKLNIIANNITDITEEYFNYSKLTMNIGVQGIKSVDEETKYDTQTPIQFYTMNMSDVEVKLYKINALEDVLVKTIKDSDLTSNSINLNDLSVGEYYIEYQKNGNPLYVKGHPLVDYFKQQKFAIIPSQCVFTFEHKGKVYDNFDKKVTGKVKVMMSCEEGGKILYSVNNKDWQEGNEVVCGDGGNYTVYAKVIIDGVESEIKTVVIRTSLNPVIPDGVMLILILLFTMTIFIVVVPLVSKKVFKNKF